MTTYEFFVERWELEQPAFRKVLQAIPDGGLDYRPHERSTSAGDLAWQLAREQGDLISFLTRGEASWTPMPRPATMQEIIEAWDKATSELRPLLSAADQAKVTAEVDFKVGEESVWKDSLERMLWGFLFDMVHHRGQLSTYLRPMGARVPAIYGPSGDDAGR
jgi:uncharacterized damage-inducible protein DinB